MKAAWLIAVMTLGALGAGAASGPSIQDTEVHLENTAYNPDSVTIVAGDTVVWDNLDALIHTVTADDGSFESPPMLNGAVFSHTFAEPGVFAYHCDFHAAMVGTVRVSDPNALPDLVVSGIALPDAIPATIPGVQQVVEVTVRNLGTNQAPATHMTLSYRYQGDLRAIGGAGIEALGPDATQTVSLTWDTLLKVGDFQLVAVADSDAEAVEADEANNVGEATASVLLAGIPGVDLLDPL